MFGPSPSRTLFRGPADFLDEIPDTGKSETGETTICLSIIEDLADASRWPLCNGALRRGGRREGGSGGVPRYEANWEVSCPSACRGRRRRPPVRSLTSGDPKEEARRRCRNSEPTLRSASISRAMQPADDHHTRTESSILSFFFSLCLSITLVLPFQPLVSSYTPFFRSYCL